MDITKKLPDLPNFDAIFHLAAIANPTERDIISFPVLRYMAITTLCMYGPRMDLKTQYGRVIPNFIRWALASEPLAINGDGTQERSFCYIDDFLECVVKTLEKKSEKHHILNIGEPKPIKILTLAQKINWKKV